MPWSGGVEPSSTTVAPISTSSTVMLYVKHPIGASAHEEALFGTLLISSRLGAVLVFRPRCTLSCITHYAESNDVLAWWECTLQKVWRKRVGGKTKHMAEPCRYTIFVSGWCSNSVRAACRSIKPTCITICREIDLSPVVVWPQVRALCSYVVCYLDLFFLLNFNSVNMCPLYMKFLP
jgi:hypothetical protein